MAKPIGVFDLIGHRVLVTRESARVMSPALAEAIGMGEGEVSLDFSGVAGVTPSFLDEVLRIIEEQLSDAPLGRLKVFIQEPPTRLSAKFAAVARAHGLVIEEAEGSGWLITRAA